MNRRYLLRGSLLLLLTRTEIARGATIVAVRVWPGPDYSRVTIESDALLRARQVFVSNPPRLAVDLEGIDLNPELRELVRRVLPDDPYIAGVRVGQNAPGLVRMVFDLKQPVLPQVFNLPPVAAYSHRLLIDVYPTEPIDPLQALIAERLRERSATPITTPTSTPTPPKPASADPLGELIAQRSSAGTAITAPPATPPLSASSAAPAIGAGPRPATAGTTAASSTQSDPRAGAGTRSERLIIVALDAGHGGEDPGAIGPGGTREKDVVLALALSLRERINVTSVNGNPMRAFLTRDADYFVPLQVRVQKARRVQADLFVSLHADAFFTARPQGASVFALSEGAASSATARWLANKENAADGVGGVNIKTQDPQLQRALLEMSTSAQINDSLKLGASLLSEMGRVGRLHKPQVEQAGFAVLKAPDIPSVLVETAFISNPEEEARLANPRYREQLADAIMRGLLRYFAANPPLARNRPL